MGGIYRQENKTNRLWASPAHYHWSGSSFLVPWKPKGLRIASIGALMGTASFCLALCLFSRITCALETIYFFLSNTSPCHRCRTQCLPEFPVTFKSLNFQRQEKGHLLSPPDGVRLCQGQELKTYFFRKVQSLVCVRVLYIRGAYYFFRQKRILRKIVPHVACLPCM